MCVCIGACVCIRAYMCVYVRICVYIPIRVGAYIYVIVVSLFRRICNTKNKPQENPERER